MGHVKWPTRRRPRSNPRALFFVRNQRKHVTVTSARSSLPNCSMRWPPVSRCRRSRAPVWPGSASMICPWSRRWSALGGFLSALFSSALAGRAAAGLKRTLKALNETGTLGSVLVLRATSWAACRQARSLLAVRPFYSSNSRCSSSATCSTVPLLSLRACSGPAGTTYCSVMKAPIRAAQMMVSAGSFFVIIASPLAALVPVWCQSGASPGPNGLGQLRTGLDEST